MNQCTSSDLEGYLRDYGWSFKRGGKGVWHSGFSTDHRSYPVRIMLDDNFLTISVQPLIAIDIDLEAFPELTTYLLELTYQSYMVRLGIDEVGDISMSINLMVGFLEKESVQIALSLLGHYSDLFYTDMVGFLSKTERSFGDL